MNQLQDNLKTYLDKKVYFDGPFVVELFCYLGVDCNNNTKDSELKIGKNAHIRSHSIIYKGSCIGTDFVTGHNVLIRENCCIGNFVSIGSHSVIEHDVSIENNVRIHSNAFIPEFSILEESCWIGPNVVLTNSRYPASKDSKKYLVGPIIGKGAKVGANSTVLPGVKIGKYALIGAGSVVVKDVEDYAVYAGNPAKKINEIKNLPYEDDLCKCP